MIPARDSKRRGKLPEAVEQSVGIQVLAYISHRRHPALVRPQGELAVRQQAEQRRGGVLPVPRECVWMVVFFAPALSRRGALRKDRGEERAWVKAIERVRMYEWESVENHAYAGARQISTLSTCDQRSI